MEETQVKRRRRRSYKDDYPFLVPTPSKPQPQNCSLQCICTRCCSIPIECNCDCNTVWRIACLCPLKLHGVIPNHIPICKPVFIDLLDHKTSSLDAGTMSLFLGLTLAMKNGNNSSLVTPNTILTEELNEYESKLSLQEYYVPATKFNISARLAKYFAGTGPYEFLGHLSGRAASSRQDDLLITFLTYLSYNLVLRPENHGSAEGLCMAIEDTLRETDIVRKLPGQIRDLLPFMECVLKNFASLNSSLLRVGESASIFDARCNDKSMEAARIDVANRRSMNDATYFEDLTIYSPLHGYIPMHCCDYTNKNLQAVVDNSAMLPTILSVIAYLIQWL